MNDRPRAGAFLERFDLSPDQATPEAIDETVRAGVVFRGTNLWLLIFAIAIASVGLNVNSTAVIIGAMLVSPLMGPIMGVGYGAAVADFALVRLSAWNLAIATLVSVVVSAIYFWFTPLAEAHSELLARTSPTIWDVLIALFGGLAGVVAVTRREKSNVLPGVAIATALMPPLCTAGFGIASANLAYFAGAFYLFCINSVFIAAATFVMCQVMHLPEVAHADAGAARRAHRWVAGIVIGTALPSIYLAHRLVTAEIYTSNAERFVASAFPPESGSFVVDQDIRFDERKIRLTVVGEPVSDERKAAIEAMLPSAGLEGTSLAIGQSRQQTVDVASLRTDLAQDLYERTATRLDEREREIDALKTELAKRDANALDEDAIEREVLAQHPDFERVVVTDRRRGDAIEVTLLVERTKDLPAADRERLSEWLRVRTGAASAWVVIVPPAPPPPAARPRAAQ